MSIKRRNKKKKQNSYTIKIDKFVHMLKNVWLNGLIDECVIKLKKKNAIIEAVDLTNNILVSSKVNVLKSSIEKIRLGIIDINIIIKFLSTIKDTKIQAEIDDKNNILKLKREDSKRAISYNLKDPDAIATVPDEEIGNKYVDMQDYYSTIDNIFAKDFIAYINLLGKDSSREANIKYDGENIEFICGVKNENQFSLILDSEVVDLSESGGDVDIVVDGEYLSKILNTITFDNENKPYIYIGEDNPLVIKTSDTMWALSPIVTAE